MSAPGAPHGLDQNEEAGGQPLVYGSIPASALLQRSSGASTHLIVGHTSATPITGLRLTYLDIWNETTSTYTRYRCRDDMLGNSELYVSDEGLT